MISYHIAASGVGFSCPRRWSASMQVMSKVVGGAGAMLFGFLIVYDTQQIFGSASASFGGGKRDLEYTVDMLLGRSFIVRREASEENGWRLVEGWHVSFSGIGSKTLRLWMCPLNCEFVYYMLFIWFDLGVLINGGSPKSSILIGFSLLNHPFWGPPISGPTPMFSSGALVHLGPKSHPNSRSRYALAAWNLYLDFLNFFIYLLQLFGERR